MANYDIVALGGGHNGLTAAAYMAKAGKKVLVLERKPHIGGGVSTRELITPGYASKNWRRKSLAIPRSMSPSKMGTKPH